MFAQQLLNAWSLGSVYALFALGFTLIFGVLRIISLAHGAIFMCGAYIALLLVDQAGAPLWLAFIAAMAGCGALGVALDVIVLKPLRARNAPHLAPMIATIGVAILLTSIVQGLAGAETLRFPFDAMPHAPLQFGALYTSALELAIIAIALVMMIGLLLLLKRTRFGQAIRAVAESPRTAALLGIPVEAMFRRVSFLAGGFGGAAGVLIGLSFNAVSPFMGQPILPKGIAVIILGGMGDVRGAMIGGLLLGLIEVFSVAYFSSDLRDALAFGLLFLILLLRPTGLFGGARERRA